MAAIPPELKAIFWEAIERASENERRAYLDEACAGDPDLRARIDALLLAHHNAGAFLEQPVPTPSAAWEVPNAMEAPGTIIGPYKLLEQIGEGGFGVVYLAEQRQPIRRTVALKVLKPGMDTRRVVSRFEAERQALALMDHPNIARVLDGGETASGRPFFVMELVKGVAITRYCDEHRLAPRERLALLVPVCQAVQHAHQKGIIHRDLKPSNILIAAYDGRPVPKVIDFGVAKALGQQLTEQTLVTGFQSVVGTLEYMSPEQAEFNAADIDTRSDVYSLGVLLYELLTGTTPLTKERLTRAALTEALRLIREEDPPRPSTRLSESRDTLASISAQRQLEPARLTRLVRGELDWIVMKAVTKDRSRRYETASGLARDIERYLKDEPVEARPPGKGYQLRKFLKRHKGVVLAVTAVMLALVAGIVGTSWGMVQAERSRGDADKAREAQSKERQRAEDNARKALAAAAAERRAKETAQTREAETRAVLDFVENKIFAAARPETREGGLGPEVKLRRAIEAALPFVDQSFRDQPLTEARLRMALGTSFFYLGEGKIAAEQWERASPSASSDDRE
jgi:serine/threonine protein kinase